jgi:hypothetical protein
MLDDAMFDVEDWLANEIATEFARAEGTAFIKGTGVNQPLGFLTSPNATTADGVRPMGTLQTIGTGVLGGFPTANPQDKLVDLVQSLRQPYRQGAVFVMNSATAAIIRKFKTTDGAFIWQPGLVAGQPSTLLGYPVIEAEDMPDVAANSLSIAFGIFKAGYVIAERAETSILRDPYTKKPYVYFYAPQIIDILTQPVVASIGSNKPAAVPVVGDMHVVGSNPEGAWAHHSDELAAYTSGGWRFIVPFEKLTVLHASSGLAVRYERGKWNEGRIDADAVFVQGKQVLASRGAAISSPVGGSVRDLEVRQAVDQILSVLRSHGLIEP